VIAPAKVARRPGDRIKTDRRDALLLARAARAGDLVSVMIPDEREEAIRDLTRSREDAVRARLKARQQLKAMLLRHGHRYSGRSSWTAAHERYLARSLSSIRRRTSPMPSTAAPCVRGTRALRTSPRR